MSVALILAGYLVGSIPFAWLLARYARGLDIRRTGSGNVGAANVARSAGVATGLAVLALDLGKGLAVVMVAQRITRDPMLPAAAGLAAILGHIYPVWLRFRGGKGVATACGVFCLLAPVAVMFAVALFLLTVLFTRYVSLGSVVATLALGPAAYLTHAGPVAVVGALVASAIVLERHRPNLARLHAGTERRLGQRA